MRKDANSVDDVNSNTEPSFGTITSAVEGVETMHVLPDSNIFGCRKGKDIVRTVGNRTGRDGRNGRPLGGDTLVEVGSFTGLPKRSHSSESCLIGMLADGAGDVQELLHDIQQVQLGMGHVCRSQNGDNSSDVGDTLCSPQELRFALVGVTEWVDEMVATHSRNRTPEFLLDVVENGTSVIALRDAGLGMEVLSIPVRLTMTQVTDDANSAFSQEESTKLCGPEWVKGLAVDVFNQGATPISILSTDKYST